PASGRAPRVERGLCTYAIGRSDDQLLAIEQAEGGSLRVEERRRLLHDLVEHGRRVELAREQAARARQLLRKRTGSALGLEQLASVEGPAGGVGQVARTLQRPRAARWKAQAPQPSSRRALPPRPGRSPRASQRGTETVRAPTRSGRSLAGSVPAARSA